MMWPETATALELARTAIAATGVVAASAVAAYTVRDFRVLRREGVNGPTGVVYAEKFVLKGILLLIQALYTAVGVAALLAPQPVPPDVAALLLGVHARATISVQTYLLFAVWVSVLVTSVVLAGSIWQLISRQRLVMALRAQVRHARSVSAAQAQQDRIEATGNEARDLGRDTNARIRRLRREGAADAEERDGRP